MQSVDSVSVLRKLLRTYFEDESSAEKAAGNHSEEQTKGVGAPKLDETEDPYALQAWIQRVYAQLVGSSSRANRDVQAAYVCCRGQPVTLGGKLSQAFDAGCMQLFIPVLAAVVVLHPFFMRTQHLMIAPTVEHFGDIAKWGRHSVTITGSRGDAAGGSATAVVTVTEDRSFDPSSVIYPILAVIWLLVCWAVQRVHAVSGVTRAVVRSLGTVVHEDEHSQGQAVSGGRSGGSGAGNVGAAPPAAIHGSASSESGSSGASRQQDAIVPAPQPSSAGRTGSASEEQETRIVTLLESQVATRDDKVSPNIPTEVPVVLPVFGGVNIVIGQGVADAGGSAGRRSRSQGVTGAPARPSAGVTHSAGGAAQRGVMARQSSRRKRAFLGSSAPGSSGGSSSGSDFASSGSDGETTDDSDTDNPFNSPSNGSGRKSTRGIGGFRHDFIDEGDAIVANRYTTADEAVAAAHAATDCLGGLCRYCCIDVDELLFAPIQVCGVTFQAASWSVVGVYILGWLTSIAVDLTEGYPGAGMWCLAFLAPVVVLVLCTADFGLVIGTYLTMTVLYIFWVLLFAAILGLDDMETPDGANLVGIAIGMLVGTTPYYAIGTFFLAARRFTAVVVRNRVELCMQAVGRVEADHELATQAARIQMPPFAMRLLHSEAAAVELEDTTAILVLRLHLRCERLTDGSRVRGMGTDALGGLQSAGSRRGPGMASSHGMAFSSRSGPSSESRSVGGSSSASNNVREPQRLQVTGSGKKPPKRSPAAGLAASEDYDSDASTDPGAGIAQTSGIGADETRKQRAADYDVLLAEATLSSVLAVERVLRSEQFKKSVTCVNIVGNDIVIAVHGNSSMVFGLGADQEKEDTATDSDSPAEQSASESPASGASGPRGFGTSVMSGGVNPDESTTEGRPITPDAATCFNIVAAIEVALRASWYVQDQDRSGSLSKNVRVRVGAGIAIGSKTVCGFLSSGSSAHRWSVFGDGATEALTLAGRGPGVRISSRALERLQSPSSWGIVTRETLDRMSKVTGATTNIVMPWTHAMQQQQQQQGGASQAQGQANERYLVAQWRKQIREAGKRLLQSCVKQPMPVDAVAFGATVPATHLYEIPVAREFDPITESLHTAASASLHDRMARDARPGQASETTWMSRGGPSAQQSFRAESALKRSTSKLLNILTHMRNLASARTYKPAPGELMLMSPESKRQLLREDSAGETGGDRRVRPVMSMMGSTTMGSQMGGMSTMTGSTTLRAFVASSMQVNSLHQSSFSLQQLPQTDIVRKQLGLPRMAAGVEQALVKTMMEAERVKHATAKRARQLWTDNDAAVSGGQQHGTGRHESSPAGAAGRPAPMSSAGSSGTDSVAYHGGGVPVRTISAMVHRSHAHPSHVHQRLQAAAEGPLFRSDTAEPGGSSEEPADHHDLNQSKDSDKVVRSSQYRYQRTAVTRLLQSPTAVFMVGIMSLLDSLFRTLRLTYAGPATFRITREDMSNRSLEAESLNLYASVVLLLLGVVALVLRYVFRGPNRVFITGDSENGAMGAAFAISALLGYRVVMWFSTQRLMRDPATACLSAATLETLPLTELTTIAIVLTAVHAADIHGYFRPPVWLRTAGVVCILVVGVWSALEMGTNWGLESYAGNGVEDRDEVLFGCEQMLSPDYVASGAVRVIIGLRMIVATLAIVYVQDERGIVLLALGDRIMKELSQLSKRMVHRKRVVYKVVSQLLPQALLTALVQEESRAMEGRQHPRGVLKQPSGPPREDIQSENYGLGPVTAPRPVLEAPTLGIRTTKQTGGVHFATDVRQDGSDAWQVQRARRLVMSKHKRVAVLSVRFRVAQMLDSLVSAVSLFRLVRVLAAVVEESCQEPFCGGDAMVVRDSNGKVRKLKSAASKKSEGKKHSGFATGMRCNVHRFGMTVIFDDGRPAAAKRKGWQHLGGYCPVMHALLSASTAISKVTALEQEIQAKLSFAAAVHFGGVVMGTVGTQGQAWDVYGQGISEATALAANTATLVSPGMCSIALSAAALHQALPEDEELVRFMRLRIAKSSEFQQSSEADTPRKLPRAASSSSAVGSRSKRHGKTPAKPTGGLQLRTEIPLPGAVHRSGEETGDKGHTRKSVDVGGDSEPIQMHRDLKQAAPVSVTGARPGNAATGAQQSSVDSSGSDSDSTSGSDTDSSSGSGSSSSSDSSESEETWGKSARTGTWRSDASSQQSDHVRLLVQGSQLRIRGVGSEWSPSLHDYLVSLAYSSDEPIQRIAGALQPRTASGLHLDSRHLGLLRTRRAGDPPPLTEVEVAETLVWLFGSGYAAKPISASSLALRLSGSRSHDDSENPSGQSGQPDAVVSSLAPPQLSASASSGAGAGSQGVARHKMHTHWAGTCLARLKKLRLLGAGAFGRVFMVVDTVSGASGALKLFQKKQTLRDEVRGEVTSLAALPRHPGVMRLAVCLAMTDRMAIVTEFIDGTTLSNIVANGKRMRDDALKVVLAQLVCAIGVCHQGGILHRDIKPGNIMVDAESGAVKLIDFGLSVEMKAQDGKRKRRRSRGGAQVQTRDAAGNVVLRKSSALDRAREQYGEDLPVDLILRESHARETQSKGTIKQLSAVSPCMTLHQAHQRMAQLMLPPTHDDGSPPSGPNEQARGGSSIQNSSSTPSSVPTTSRYPGGVTASPRSNLSASHLLARSAIPMHSCVQTLNDGTRLVTALSMLVFDQSLADPRQLESLRKSGKKHLREASSSSAAGDDSAETSQKDVASSRSISSVMGFAVSEPGHSSRIQDSVQDFAVAAAGKEEAESSAASGGGAAGAAVGVAPTPGSQLGTVSTDDVLAHRYVRAVEHNPSLVQMKSVGKPLRSELERIADIFDIVDEDDRIVPSLVWTPAQLKSALANDSSMFDTVLVTDVADIETAIGVLLIVAQIMPPAVQKDANEIYASGRRAKSDGLELPVERRRRSLSLEAEEEHKGQEDVPDIALLVPRVVMVFDERLSEKECRRIRKKVDAVCEGIVMLQLEQSVKDLYGYVVLPGFARAARWQDMVKLNAEGGDSLDDVDGENMTVLPHSLPSARAPTVRGSSTEESAPAMPSSRSSGARTAESPVSSLAGARAGGRQDGNEAKRLRDAFDAPILELKREFAKGFAGSPAFIAPEVIKGENVGYAADWYSLGVLAFRAYAGRLPYEGSTTDEVLINGRDGRVNWQLLPRRENPELLDLIVGLLENDPNKRYGSRAGALHLMRHPYFYDVNWDEIYAQPSPLVDQEAATIAEAPERFTDAMSAVQMIRYSRGTVSSFPLAPRQHRIGGWKGMPASRHFGIGSTDTTPDSSPVTPSPGAQTPPSDQADKSHQQSAVGTIGGPQGFQEVGNSDNAIPEGDPAAALTAPQPDVGGKTGTTSGRTRGLQSVDQQAAQSVLDWIKAPSMQTPSAVAGGASLRSEATPSLARGDASQSMLSGSRRGELGGEQSGSQAGAPKETQDASGSAGSTSAATGAGGGATPKAPSGRGGIGMLPTLQEEGNDEMPGAPGAVPAAPKASRSIMGGSMRRGEARWTGSMSRGSKHSMRILQSQHGGSRIGEELGSTRIEFDLRLGKIESRAQAGGTGTSRSKSKGKKSKKDKGSLSGDRPPLATTSLDRDVVGRKKQKKSKKSGKSKSSRSGSSSFNGPPDASGTAEAYGSVSYAAALHAQLEAGGGQSFDEMPAGTLQHVETMLRDQAAAKADQLAAAGIQPAALDAGGLHQAGAHGSMTSSIGTSSTGSRRGNKKGKKEKKKKSKSGKSRSTRGPGTSLAGDGAGLGSSDDDGGDSSREERTAKRVGKKIARELDEEPSKAAREVGQMLAEAQRKGKIRSVAMARSVHGHSAAAAGAFFNSTMGSKGGASRRGESLSRREKGKKKKEKKSKKGKSQKRGAFETEDDLL